MRSGEAPANKPISFTYLNIITQTVLRTHSAFSIYDVLIDNFGASIVNISGKDFLVIKC